MTELEWLYKFSDKLRDEMKFARITQSELAEEAMLSESSISDYINARKMPKVKAIVNIAYALGCGIDELIYFDDMID